MIKIAIITFTAHGVHVARKIACALSAQGEITISAPEKLVNADYSDSADNADNADEPIPLLPIKSLASWCAQVFASNDALIFVSATGIAVRSIAAHLKSKYTDPAVICIDEQGKFIIPLASGHVGGANELARTIAKVLDATPVITTATDGRGLFAIDEWARTQNLAIVEHDLAKEVSAALLAGTPVAFACNLGAHGMLHGGLPCGFTREAQELGVLISFDDTAQLFPHTLHLVPRRLTLGMGCRRNTSTSAAEAAVKSALEQAQISKHAIVALSSIDLKADEPALAELAHKYNWDLRFYTADELNAVPGTFASSDFVRQTTGTGNVCERAAAYPHGHVVAPKYAADGVTVALGCEPFVLTLPEVSKGGIS